MRTKLIFAIISPPTAIALSHGLPSTKFIKKYARSLLIITGALFSAACCALDIGIFKDTHTLFKKRFQHLSPVHGMTAWEHKIPENYFIFCTPSVQPTDRWLPDIPGPERLARALFVKKNGTISPSMSKLFPTAHVGPSTLAAIMAHLEQHTQQALDSGALEDTIMHDQSFLACVLPGTTQPTIRDLALAKLDTNRLFYEKKRRLKMSFLSEHLAGLRLLTGKAKSDAQREMSKLAQNVQELEKNTCPPGDYNRLREFSAAVIDAAHTTQAYPPLSAHTLLLAFLCSTTKNRKDLVDYLESLRARLGNGIFKKTHLSSTPSSAAYTSTDIPAIQQLMRVCAESPPEHLNAQFNRVFEPIAFAATHQTCRSNTLPPFARFLCVLRGNYTYSDCTETALRNWHNAVILRQKTCCTSQIPDLTHVQDHAVHQAWANCLVHQPCISYRACIPTEENSQKKILFAPPDTMGFIFGLDEERVHACEKKDGRIRIGSGWYIPVDPTSCTLCEMLPSIRNFVISLDRLFTLNLFSQLSSDFFSADFNTTYVPKLLQRLPQLGTCTLGSTQLHALDVQDCTDTKIHIPLEECRLYASRQHAELVATKSYPVDPDIAPQVVKAFSTTMPNSTTPHLAHVLVALPTAFATLFDVCGPAAFYLADVRTPAAKMAVIDWALQSGILERLPEKQAKDIAHKMVQLIGALDVDSDWKYQRQVIKHCKPEHLVGFLKPVVAAWAQAAQESLHKPYADPESVLYFFALLAARGLYIDVTQKIAADFQKSEDPAICQAVQTVLKALQHTVH